MIFRQTLCAPGCSAFPQTRWTVILAAKGGAEAEAMEALAEAYWRPMYAWLRRQGRSHEEAQDDVQGFFAWVLGREFLRNVQPEGGRFRNFLLVCLRRWLRDERVRVVNVKRSAEVALEPWHEAEAAGLNTEAAPEEVFDKTWAESLVARALEALQARWAGRAELFAALRLTLECAGDAERYGGIAARLGMTEGAVGKAAHDLRRQFAEQVRCEVRDTVARDEDVEEELRYLVRLLRH